jgi:hypothetical protein
MSGSAKPQTGKHAWFVRYISTSEGWTHETVRGRVEKRTETGWLLRVGNDLQQLPDTEWSFYRP